MFQQQRFCQFIRTTDTDELDHRHNISKWCDHKTSWTKLQIMEKQKKKARKFNLCLKRPLGETDKEQGGMSPTMLNAKWGLKKNPNKRLLSGAFNAFQCSLQTFFVIAKRQIGKRADSKPLPSWDMCLAERRSMTPEAKWLETMTTGLLPGCSGRSCPR